MKRSLKTKLTTILLSLAMLFTMIPIATNTIKADDVYTVTLSPGAGVGTPITISSTDHMYPTPDNGSNVPRGYFYEYTADNKIWFRFPDLPDTFIAPDDYLFDKWDPDVSPGGHYCMSGNTTDLTITAQWKKDLSKLTTASYSLSPSSYTITQSGYTDIECVFTSFEKGKIESNGQQIEVDAIQFTLNKGTLTDGNGNSISFLVDDEWHFDPSDSEMINPIGDSNESFTAAVFINENDFNAAAPGTYTGTYQIDSTWIGVNSSERISGNPHSIALRLIVPDPSISHTVTFFDEDGTTILQTGDWAEGSTPVYSGQTPTKPADAQYTYTFAGWTPAISTVIGDATYTATYEKTLRKYTVKFVNDDGTELQSSQVNYGETPSYTGATPTKQADAQYTYTFDKWTPDITAVTETVTYTATYNKTSIDAMILTVTPYEGEYDGVSHGTAATTNVDGATIQYSTDGGTNWSTTVPTLTDVGTIEVTAKATAIGYVEKTATSRLTINPAPITITTGSASKEYDGMPLTNNNATITGLVNGETATVNATGSQTEIGSSTNTYSINWGTTNPSNYVVIENLGTLTVSGNTTEITLIADSGSKIYDGTPLTNSNVMVTGLPPGFTVDNVTMTAVSTITDVGMIPNVIDSYEIKNSAGEDKTVNFTNVRKVAGTLEIRPKSVTVKADGKIKTFGDADPEFTAEVIGLIQGDELIYTLSREPGEVVGAHEIKATGKVEQDNYKVSYESGTLVIRPKSVTVKADNKTKAFGDKDPEFTATVQGLLQGDELIYTLSREDGEEAGEYEITATGEEEQGNYVVSYEHGTLTIVAYTNEAGNNSSWTKGDTKTLDFTFKRSEDDQDTYDIHFIGIEVDGKEVNKSKYESKSGSVIISLKPEYLESLSVGKHTIKAIFNDGNATADFTIKEKGNNNNNNKTYNIPKTGVE